MGICRIKYTIWFSQKLLCRFDRARATGMSDWKAMRYVVLPQTLPIILPAMTNQTLSLVKESAVLSTITVGELTMAAITVQGETFRPFEAFIMIALMYWALSNQFLNMIAESDKGILFGIPR